MATEPNQDPNTINFTDSSNIKSVAYDEPNKQATVTFKNGGVYTYGSITREMIADWRAAPSGGKYFSETIKANKSKYPVISMSGPAQKESNVEDNAATNQSQQAQVLSQGAPASLAPNATKIRPAGDRNFTERDPDAEDLGAPGVTKDQANIDNHAPVGKHGSKAARVAGKMYGSPTEGIVANNAEAKEALARTEEHHRKHMAKRDAGHAVAFAEPVAQQTAQTAQSISSAAATTPGK